MAKLYFRYGTVGCAKTLNLLAVAHNYEQQGKKVWLVKPKVDVRFGKATVQSRAGLSREADIVVDEDTNLKPADFKGLDCLLVDECQFMRDTTIDQFRSIADEAGVPVICYGLRTDFRKKLFAGAQRLLEIADAIEEVKTTCYKCNKKAIFNLKLADGVATLAGPQVCLGCEETYVPTCSRCYNTQLEKAGEKKPNKDVDTEAGSEERQAPPSPTPSPAPSAPSSPDV